MVRKNCKQLQEETNDEKIIEIIGEIIQKIQDKEKAENRKDKCLDEKIVETIVKLLNTEKDEIIEEASKLLRSMLSEHEKSQNLVMKSEIPSIVIKLLDKYYLNVNIANSLIGSIWGMSQIDNKTKFINSTTVKMFDKLFENKNIDVLTSIMGSLLTLASEDDFVCLIENSKIMSNVSEIMKYAEDNEFLARLIGGFLLNAGSTQKNQNDFLNANGVDNLINLLEKYQNNETIVMRLLNAIRSLSGEDEDTLVKMIEIADRFIAVVEKLGKDSVVENLMGIFFNFSQTDDKEMEIHSKCTKILTKYINKSENGCSLALGYLMNLSLNDEVAEEMAKDKDLIKEVKEALDHNEENAKIIARGSQFIANICSYEESKKYIIEYEVVHDVIEGLKKHRDENDVLKSIMACLTNMSNEDDLVDEIVKEDGINKEIDHILDDCKEESIVKSTLIALANILSCRPDADNVDEDYAKHIIEIVDKFDAQIVKEKAFVALGFLSFIPETKKDLMEHGILKTVLKNFSISQITESKGLQIVFCLTDDITDYVDEIVKSGVIEMCKKAVPWSPTCAEQFNGLVANCAKVQESDIHSLLLPYLDEVMKIINFQKTERSVDFGIMALLNLAIKEETREAMRSMKVIECIGNALNSFKTDKAICDHCFGALASLAKDEELKEKLDENNAFILCSEIVKTFNNEKGLLERITIFLAYATQNSDNNKQHIKDKLMETLEILKENGNEKTQKLVDGIKKRIE